MSIVCCPCPACQGKQVSRYIRLQHMNKFVIGKIPAVNIEDSEEVPVSFGIIYQFN